MKVRDLIEQEISIDVYDDFCDEIAIAFDGPLVLTHEGEWHFWDVLNYEVKLYSHGGDIHAVVCVDDENEEVRVRRLKKQVNSFMHKQDIVHKKITTNGFILREFNSLLLHQNRRKKSNENVHSTFYQGADRRNIRSNV